MADPLPSPYTRDNADEGPDRGSTAPYPGTPRWVKVFGIIAFVLLLLVVGILATGLGGNHGPGRHLPSGGAGGHASLLSGTAHALEQP